MLYPLIVLYVMVLRVPRARMIVVSPTGNVLLVKSWFGRQQWALPGGGIARNETGTDAAVREVYEEAGVVVDVNDVKALGQVTLHEGIAMSYKLFMASSENESLPKLSFIRRLEIIDRIWMPLADAPEEIRVLVKSRV